MSIPKAAAGHSTLSPYVMVPDARGMISFVEKVFGASILLMHNRPDGSLMHASVAIGDSVLMVADATKDYPPVTGWLHVYVDDVDAAFRTALSLGAKSVQEPTDKGDGDKRGGFSDASGITWWIATPTT